MNRARRRRIVDRLFVGLSIAATAAALAALVLILWTLAAQGLAGIGRATLTLPQPAPGSAGGLSNAIAGSALMCGAGLALAVLIGVPAGTWLAEYAGDGRYGRLVRFVNDLLLSAPSILIGLFVYELMVVRGLHRFSGVAGALALALVAVPIVTRTTEDMLAAQPGTLREAGMALGAGRGRVIRTIVWRAAAAGLATGALLAFARISGETAPLLFTALGNPFLSVDMTRPLASLPVTIFQFALSPYDDWQRLAWGGALLIAGSVLVVSVLARLAGRWARRA